MKISVLTPTLNRHEILLNRCIPSVRAQTYPDVEHVVVSDGPDPELASLLKHSGVVYAEVPDGPSGDYGCRARNLAATVATGDLFAYLDDDNAYRPDHLTRLAAALEDPDVDFAYSRMELFGPWGGEVGSAPPACGCIDSSLIVARRETLRFGEWAGGRYEVDWDIVERWLAGGARWAFVPEVTVDYWRA